MFKVRKLSINFLFLVFVFSCSSIFSELTPWPYGSICCLGDSHCPHCFTKHDSFNDFLSQGRSTNSETAYPKETSIFFFKDDNIEVPFRILYQGSCTMHRVGRDKGFLVQSAVNDEDILVFLFGEIDTRVHIEKQHSLGKRSLNEIIQTLAEKYIEKVSEESNSNCIVMSVPPTCKVDFVRLIHQTNQYFACAPWKKRVFYTAQLNKKLAQECIKRGILFFNPFGFCTNEDGTMDDQYTKDNHHIAPEFNYIIKNKLIRFILNHQSYFSKKKST